jgi:hypothetical protein
LLFGRLIMFKGWSGECSSAKCMHSVGCTTASVPHSPSNRSGTRTSKLSITHTCSCTHQWGHGSGSAWCRCPSGRRTPSPGGVPRGWGGVARVQAGRAHSEEVSVGLHSQLLLHLCGCLFLSMVRCMQAALQVLAPHPGPLYLDGEACIITGAHVLGIVVELVRAAGRQGRGGSARLSAGAVSAWNQQYPESSGRSTHHD